MPHGMMRIVAALLLTLLSVQAQSVERVIHYHNDALGSPIAATDEQGRVVWRKSYTPYGQPIDQAAPNEPGYTGKFEEPDLGIQNFGARWYDPRIGRFLAIDPAGFDPQNPQSFNRYAYANNNPYKYVDPDGRAAETALDVISLGLSATAFGNDPSLANGLGLAYDAAATAVPFLPAGFGIIKNAGNAAEAIGDAAKAEVYRQGTFANEAVGWEGNFVKGKQWANDNPSATPGYAKKYGLPAENTGKPDWIAKGRIQGDYRTRPAPASHNNPANSGGGMEILPSNPDNVRLDWFHMTD